ncbi:MAG: LAGLIDADG family homing endonuclease [Candidatus Taylorbacteria bacterium]
MGLLSKLFGKKENKEMRPQTVASILPQEIYESGALELKDVIAPSAVKVGPRELNLGEKIVRTFFVISYPRFLSEGWFSPIINLDKIFDISIFVHPIETATVLKQFQKKVAEVQSQIHDRERKGLVRDPMLDTAYQDLENLRDSLQQAQEKLFDVGLYISIYGSTIEELDKIESEIKSILEAKLVYLRPALFQQEQGYKSVLPICTDNLMVHSKMNSSPLSSLFPFISFDLTSDKGILYGINRHNSSLVLFDRFSLENYNSICFAKSGSGKSILGHEPVLVRKEGTVSLMPIGEIVEKLIEEKGATPIDHEMEGVIDPDLEVWSFNKSYSGEWSKVSVAARKDAPEKLYRFKTRSGRSIETTGDHNMLILRDGEIEVLKSTEVVKGEYLPLSRNVKRSEEKEFSLNLFELLKNRPLYIIGGNEIVSSNYAFLHKKIIDATNDKYLHLYSKKRRIPLQYFLKILAQLEISLNDARLSSCIFTTSNGISRLSSKIPVSSELGRVLGYLVSEGTISENIAIVTNIDLDILRDVEKCLEKIGVCAFSTPNSIRSGDQTFVALLSALGMKEKSGTKRIPSVIFEAGKEVQANFLKAYFEGDGGVDGAQVTAVSKSKMLVSDLAYLLNFFGIIARISPRKKQIPGKGMGDYYQLSISGQENLDKFRAQIGFVSERKNSALLGLKKNANTNVDVIPGLGNIFKELELLLGNSIRVHENNSDFHAVKREIYHPSREKLREIVENVSKTLQTIETKAELFAELSHLPTIESLLELADKNKKINELLWQELGSSWPTIRNGMKPRVANALKAFSVAKMPCPSADSLKQLLDEGFAFLREDMKAFSPSLRPALREKPEENTSYAMLQTASSFLSARYASLQKNIPKAKEILAKLEQLISSDLFFDEIVEIEEYKNTSEKYVYDLTVDNEVFFAGYGGLFVHNSYSVKLEIIRTLMFDTEVIVLDPEREYEYLSQAMGGKYFNISLNSPHHINPFDLPIPREGESGSDVLRSNIINLVGIFRIMLGGLTPEEDAIIDRAIAETYSLKDINADSDFSNIEPPLLSDFELVLAGMQGGDSLVQRLTKYTRGTWAGFLNRPTNVDINNKFIVFSLRDMEDELKPVAMYIVTHYIWNAVRKNLKKRLLVIDEAWWMMKSEDTASFLLSLAKRGRKYYLGLATITQDVDDFLKSPYGLPILTNSSIQILLKQSQTSIDKLQSIFNLTEEEKYLLLESDVGEGLFFVGLKHVAIKIIASYTEDQIITSDPSQILAIKKAKDELNM